MLLLVCPAFPVRADLTQAFTGWGAYLTFGTYTNAEWILSVGKCQDAGDYVSSPLAAWLQDIQISTNSWVKTPLMPDGVNTISFWCKSYRTAGWNDFNVEYSTNNTDWAIAGSYSQSGPTWTSVTCSVGVNSPCRVRIIKTDDYPSFTNVWMGIDDITVTDGLDVMLRELHHSPASPGTDEPVLIYVDAALASSVSNVTFTAFYRAGTSGPFSSISMTNITGNTYGTISSIPAGMGSYSTVQYYVRCDFTGTMPSPVFLPETGSNAPASYSITSFGFRALSPSSRSTPLIISEIMYNTLEQTGTNSLEFIELFNTEPVDRDIGGYRISGSAGFTFPSNTVVPARDFLVIARDPQYLETTRSLSGVLGPLDGNLPNANGTVRLLNRLGAIILEIEYSDEPPWPVEADGAGHSLVLSKPDYGENSVKSWSASSRVGGSPDNSDTMPQDELSGLVINELVAHTDLPNIDYVEFYNNSDSAMDISGVVITDDPATNRFIVPASTTIPARGFACFNSTDLGYLLEKEGGSLFVVNSNGTRVVAALKYGAQANSVPVGRYPDGTDGFHNLISMTSNAPNSGLKIDDIVINEIMYHPITGLEMDEYIELYNKGTGTIDLSYWKFTAGINFTIPSGTTLASGSYLVIANNVTNLIAKYPALNTANTIGDYGGSLANGGELVALSRPEDIAFPYENFVIIDEVTYNDGDRWGKWADGGGSSLELIDPRSDNRLSGHWAGSDETGSAGWTTFDRTWKLDMGDGTVDSLQVYMLQAGECLIDNIEVVTGGSTVNLSEDFESGIGNWNLAQGNCARSTWKTNEGYLSGSSMHLRGSGGGNVSRSTETMPFLNHASIALSPVPNPDDTTRISAKARWTGGWPYIVFGLEGFYSEASGKLNVPDDLGTPGERNSRYAANGGPAIEDVKHSPVLPGHRQPIIVTSRLQDPDGIGSAFVNYRIDPFPSYTAIAMNDDGTGGDDVAGDGTFSAAIPGQPSGSLVGFTVTASDAIDAGKTNSFPDPPGPPPDSECLVRVGVSLPDGIFGTYMMWMTETNETIWTERDVRSNEPLEGTFTCGNIRSIYNVGGRYRGYKRYSDGGPAGSDPIAYVVELPKSEPFLGANELKLDTVGQHGIDSTLLIERLSYWVACEVDIPYCYLRFVHVYFNGSDRGIMHDAETPAPGFVKSWYPDDEDPQIFKNVGWDPLEIYNTTGGIKKKERYRQSWAKQRTLVPDDDYNTLYRIVDAVNIADTNQYHERVSAVIDMDNWMGMFAVNHGIGNWDSFGYDLHHNLFIYVADTHRSRGFLYDLDYSFAASATADLFTASDTITPRMYGHQPFRRMFLRYIREIAQNAYDPAKSTAMMNDWYNAFQANGISSDYPTALQTWIAARRTYMLGQLPSSLFEITNNGGANFSTTNRIITLTGNAPIEVMTMLINSNSHDAAFSTTTAWSTEVGLTNGANPFVVEGFDRHGNLLYRDTITITFTGTPVSPAGQLVITEIMYHPVRPKAEFIEIHNLSGTDSFDLTGWRLNGVDLVFDGGSVIGPGEYRVVAEDRQGYASAYTNSEAVIGKYDGDLDNGGETIQLLQPLGTNDWIVIDEVRYSDRLPWPAEAAGHGPSIQLIDPDRDNNRIGNWAIDLTAVFTPGAANSVDDNLPAFPLVWINEVMPSNTTTITDNNSGYEPWVELYNADSGTIDLNAGNYYLTDDCGDLTKWAFPAPWTIAANSRLLVWADNAPGETAAGFLHAGFELNSASGCVTLVMRDAGRDIVLDSVDYFLVGADYSYGSYPEGSPVMRQVFHDPTPGTVNSAVSPSVALYVNEWMADSSGGFYDPTDGKPEDWFELYNASGTAIDLGGYYLTDDITDTNKFVIPGGTVVGPWSFRVIWADNDDEDNGPGIDLHVNFGLGRTGDAIHIYSPGGSLVDSVTFGLQRTDVSQGRWPDSGTMICDMQGATPGSSNIALLVTSVRNTVSDTASMEWLSVSGGVYELSFAADLQTTNWAALGVYTAFTARAVLEDPGASGATNRFYRIRRIE